MKVSRRSMLMAVAVAAAALPAACGPSERAGAFTYDCYLGPLEGTKVVVRWSENGKRADTVIAGRAYVFRFASADIMTDTFKDGEAVLSIDPELRFAPGPHADASTCNTGSPVQG